MERDSLIFDAIDNEKSRQLKGIELIASENFVSEQVLEAQGSILTNKYAEGYPGRRYYGGCEYVDVIEQEAIDRVKKLFGAEFANVQPHSGSSANMAVYRALLEPGDKVLGMDLDEGGHLTHGSPVNFSGKTYDFHGYGTDEDNFIDYQALENLAQEIQPKLIIGGATAYSRQIDFKRIGEIAQSVGAIYMVDMAHIAGLVAAGEHQNPVPYADIVTTTTHKTLRGPRGGIIMGKEEYAKKINSSVFPGMQGGPLEHVIAAKAVALGEASQDEFKTYAQQIIKNAQTLAEVLMDGGLDIITGGTDNHLMLVDLRPLSITGKEAQERLEAVNIATNKNSIPNDPEKPTVTSGLRIGTPAITTRGFKEEDVVKTGQLIIEALKDEEHELEDIKARVVDLVQDKPIFAW